MAQKIWGCVFTINNWRKIEDLSGFYKELENISAYGVVGEEIGEKKKTEHLQGYMEFRNPRSRKSIGKSLRNNWFEKPRGNGQQASDYCKKDGSYVEWGILKPGQGKRTELDNTRNAVSENVSLREIIISGTARNYQGIRMAEKLLTIFEKGRTDKPEVKWFWGATECGKSWTAKHEALELAGGDLDKIYFTSKNGKWWDGYDKHELVIINDIRADWIKFEDLLCLLDEDPYRVENKGGSRQFLGKHIWITCPMHPAVVFENTLEDVTQLTRRIKIIQKFKINYRTGTEVMEQKSGVIYSPDRLEIETPDDF